MVSRYEAHITFPRDSNTKWGWPAGDSQKSPRPNYVWYVSIPGTIGPKWVMARVYNPYDSIGASYRSLASMLRSPDVLVGICMPGMFVQCDGKHTTVTVGDGRVTISVRDSAQVSELFGMLPDSAIGLKYGDSVEYKSPVHYIEPRIASPDSAFRATRA